MNRLICLLALLTVPAAAQGSGPTAEADSLLDLVFERAGYDRFLNRTHSLVPPEAPGPIPNPSRVRDAWQELMTPAWYRARLRATFLRDHSAEDVQAVYDWLADPLVREAITYDYEAAAGETDEAYERTDAARAAGALDPRFVRAARRVAEAAGSGVSSTETYIDLMIEYTAYAARVSGEPGFPTRAEMDAEKARILRATRADSADDMLRMILVRFEAYPVDKLEHYAEALEAPAGQSYLRLVTHAPGEVQVAALRIALGKAAK